MLVSLSTLRAFERTDNMQVVILAGGEGRRLRPLTCDMPKPLVRMLGVPVIKRLLHGLKECGFDRATVADYYLADLLESSLGSSCEGVDVEYVREKTPLGTAGCVRAAWSGSGDTLVVSGDSVCSFDFSKAAAFHSSHNADVTILAHRVADPREYGLITSDEEGRITGFIEKPGYDRCLTDAANTGTYIISESVMKRIPVGENVDFAKDVFPQLLKDGKRLYCRIEDGIWHDIGDIPSFIKCQRELLERSGKKYLVCSGAGFDESAMIGDGSVLEADSYVGAECRIQGSCVMRRAAIGDGSTLTGCIVSDGAVLGRGCKIGKNAVVGSGCILGAAVTVDEGVRIYPNTKIPSGSRVREDVDEQGYRLLSMEEYGAACGISNSPMDAMRLGMAVVKSLEPQTAEIAVGYSGEQEYLVKALSLGAGCAGARVYNLGRSTAAMTVYAARKLSLRYCIHVSDAIRIMRSDRIELARSEERKIEMCFNRGELPSGLESVPETDVRSITELYKKELAGTYPAEFRGDYGFESGSEEEKQAFWCICGSNGRDDCVKDRAGCFVRVTGTPEVSVVLKESKTMFSWSHLIILACKARLAEGKDLYLTPRAPAYCNELAEKAGRTAYRIYPDDSAAVDDYCWDPIALVANSLKYCAENKKSLADALNELPEMYYEQRTITTRSELPKILREDFCGLQNDSMGRDIILHTSGATGHIKPKKSGKALALYVEAVSAEAAAELCDDVLRRLGDGAQLDINV